MIDIIVACDEDGGIGRDGKIPWDCPEDLRLFQTKTMGCNVIVGRKTCSTLPLLKGRKLYVVTEHNCDAYSQRADVAWCGNLSDALKATEESGIMTFVIGGAGIYDQVLNLYPRLVHTVHLTQIAGTHSCDRHFHRLKLRHQFVPIHEEVLSAQAKVVIYRPVTSQPRKIGVETMSHKTNTHPEKQYLDLVKEVLASGNKRKTRNAETRSLFSRHLKYDLRDGFPLVTSRRTFFRGVVAELLFFLSGDTDTSKLEKQGVNIWKGNTSREFLDQSGKPDYPTSMMGPMYGYQWRSFNAQYDENSGRPHTTELGVDQLANIVNLIKTDPMSRRIMMTSFNPSQAEEGVLFPCHSIVTQFYVDGEFLDMCVYNRSQDLALGVPFNIASSALLLHILAEITGKVARDMTIQMGDVHVYESHVNSLREQLTRTPFSMPVVKLPVLTQLEDLAGLTTKDFSLCDYKYHPPIKMEMVA